MAAVSSRTPLTELPQELGLKVASYLNPRDASNLAQSCTRLKGLVYSVLYPPQVIDLAFRVLQGLRDQDRESLERVCTDWRGETQTSGQIPFSFSSQYGLSTEHMISKSTIVSNIVSQFVQLHNGGSSQFLQFGLGNVESCTITFYRANIGKIVAMNREAPFESFRRFIDM